MTWFGLTIPEWWPLLAGMVCNLACALLGCFLILRRWSLLGDAISHGVLPGIVLAFLFTGKITTVYILFGALVFGLLTALLAQTLTATGKVPEDASLGIVFTAFFALGIVLISKIKDLVGQDRMVQVDLDLSCVFFGLFEGLGLKTFSWMGLNIPTAFPTMLLGLVLTLAFITVFWKEMKISTFDPGLAAALGFRPNLMHYLFLGLVAGVAVSSFEAVGSILVLAMLIVPGATAHLLADRLLAMLIWAGGLALSASVMGFFLASRLFFETNIGGMMAVVAGVQFFLAVLFAPRHGILAKILRNFKLGLRIASEDILASLYRQEEKEIQTDLMPEPGISRLIFRLAQWTLHRQGLIRPGADKHWQLTDSGRGPARLIVRAHRLWEAYLGRHFELPLDHLHEAATRMEHFLDPHLQQELAAELQEPQTDPHGRVIPPG